MLLKERVALVTGASQGIGRALSERLAVAGCRLVLVARSAADLQELVPRLESAGSPGAVAVPGDVTDAQTARRAVGRAFEAFGRLDVLVNNAGLGLRTPVQRTEPEDLRYLFEVNVVGALHFIREAAPIMAGQGEGLVVNICSAAGLQPVPFLGGYSATKAALIALTDSLRMELAGSGVGVLKVIPGSVETGFKARALGEPYPERRGAARLSPEEVAARVIRAIESGRSELHILSRSERLGLLAGRILPGYVEKKLLRRYGGEGAPGGRRERKA
jgi:short-subunit dehydrogenase